MRLWGFLLAFLILLAIGWTAAGVAAAETLSATGKIYLQGVVAPAHYVIVDNHGTIVKIISNTTEDTVPLVYEEKLAAENQTPLTQAIYEQYQKLVPAGTSHPGILYEQSQAQPTVSLTAGTNKSDNSAPQAPGLVFNNSGQTALGKLLKQAFSNPLG